MRHIKYIIINDSMPEASRGKSPNIRIENLGYHYVINSQGEVLNPIDVSNPANLTLETRNLKPETKHLKPQEVERLNACSIGVKYNGKLSDPRLRPLLLALLNELRNCNPVAAIFALNEIRPETRHLKHETRGIIRVRKDMNLLRRELSDMI